MYKNTLRTIAIAVLLITSGCSEDSSQTQSTTQSNTDEKGHHDHGDDEAMTFQQAVEKLVEMDNTIRNGFANNDSDAAHGPLHEIGHVLESIAELAKNEEFTQEKLDAVNEAKESLFTSFGEIDKSMHGGEGSTYEKEAEGIKAALQVIKAAAGLDG